ncbi:transposase [Streptomyces sp. NPDC090023]|uniref:transposase n=1 Tax=unclassified Streptomyces TaxID=2593676 RepID=UPI0037F5F11E
MTDACTRKDEIRGYARSGPVAPSTGPADTGIRPPTVFSAPLAVHDGGLLPSSHGTWSPSIPAGAGSTCVVHLIRASLRYASRRDWAEVARDLKPVYTAVNEEEARQQLTDLNETWGKPYPSIASIWQRAWSGFVPFLGLPDAIRQVVYTINAIESLNARYRRAASACGHFPNEQAALKRLCLATLAIDPTGRGRQRWNTHWKSALDEFDVLFDGRLTAARV